MLATAELLPVGQSPQLSADITYLPASHWTQLSPTEYVPAVHSVLEPDTINANNIVNCNVCIDAPVDAVVIYTTYATTAYSNIGFYCVYLKAR